MKKNKRTTKIINVLMTLAIAAVIFVAGAGAGGDYERHQAWLKANETVKAGNEAGNIPVELPSAVKDNTPRWGMGEV